MASSQPYVINSGNRQDIKLTADSIELSDGTTTQAAVESLREKDTEFANFKGSIESKYRKENTAYAKDDISYAAELPAGFYLECTTAGTTSAGTISLPATITDGTTFSDGTVSWTIRKVVSTEDIPTVPSLSEYATTNYVDNKVSGYATTSYVDSKVPSLSGYAKLASPTFTGTPKAPTPSTSTNSTQIATTAFVQSLVSSLSSSSVPSGTIVAYGGNSIPSGWLLCDGSAVSRSSYSSLYSAIGTTWGSGNGSTTFNLPNLNFITGASINSSTQKVPVVTGTSFDKNGAYKNSTYLGRHAASYIGADSAVHTTSSTSTISYGQTSSSPSFSAPSSSTYTPLYASLSSISVTATNSSSVRYIIKY